MQRPDDITLLRQYADENSEEAFAALVARHIDKVYSVALRHARNPHQAEEITQTVFVILAKKARHFGGGIVLSGWLYQTARLTAITLIRSEIRRARREYEAHMQTILNETEPDVWPRVAPLLDAAMAGLNETDRHAVVLRFLDGHTLKEVGAALGASEDTAKKRVSRAVEKLRLFFRKRGLALPSTVLMAAISAHSVQAAPMGLAKSISTMAMTQGAIAGGSTMALVKAMLKPVMVSSGGMCAALLGSGAFMLKAELEQAKSLRERRFLLRMICLRFAMALVLVALGYGVMTLPMARRPGGIESAFAGLFFCAAIGDAARIGHFHRRRQQIQTEDGTREEFDRGEPAESAGLRADLGTNAPQANSSAALAAVFGLVGCALLTGTWVTRRTGDGHWVAATVILFAGGLACFRWIRNWRQRARFGLDPRFGTYLKTVGLYGLLTLLLVDLSWAGGRLPQSTQGAIGLNIAVLLAYAALIAVLARSRRRLALGSTNR